MSLPKPSARQAEGFFALGQREEHDMNEEGRGRGRPPVGPAIEVRLPPAVVAALEAEAAERGWKRAELLRWIVEQHYDTP